jgi:hypothetical protein
MAATVAAREGAEDSGDPDHGPSASCPPRSADATLPLGVISAANPNVADWTPARFACADGWAVAAGVSKSRGSGVAFLQVKGPYWTTTSLDDGTCKAATTIRQCPFRRSSAWPPRRCGCSCSHQAGLAVTADGTVSMAASG